MVPPGVSIESAQVNEPSKSEISSAQAKEALSQYLAWASDAGISHALLAEAPVDIPERGATEFAEKPLATVASSAVVPAPSLKSPASGTLEELRAALGECQRCSLCGARKTIVFGSGNPTADLMFIGDSPGQEEDGQGVPFVAQGGQLLTKMIEAMKLSREAVYLCNILKCRPLEGRKPSILETETCLPFLKNQISMIRPKVIVLLGPAAAQALLGNQSPFGSIRGLWQLYEGISVMPTYHPDYLLRNPGEKKPAWADLQLVMAKLGLQK